MATPMKRITAEDIMKRIRVTDDHVNETCTKEHIRMISPSVINFTKFASRFNIEKATLSEIQTNQHLDTVQKVEKVLLWWLDNIADPTYRKFMEVCIEMGEGGLAREMCKLCASNIGPDSDLSKSVSQSIAGSTNSIEKTGTGRLRSSSSLDIPQQPSSFKPRSDSTSSGQLGKASDDLENLSWEKSKIPAPADLLRPIDAVAHSNMAFFRNCFTPNIYMYDKKEKNWRQIPNCLVADTSLALLPVLHQGETIFRLHTVGGRKLMEDRQNNHDEFTGVVYQLQEIEGLNKWKQHNDYPDMKFKRAQVTVAYSDSHQYVIAAGGCDDHGVVRKVEVLNISASHREWYKVATLPEPVFRASACICNGFLYILGGHVCDPEKGYLVPTDKAYKASIDELINSLARNKEVFTPITSLHLNESACVAFHDNLLAIGGWEFDGDRSTGTKLVYVYDELSNKWNKFGRINEPRCQHFAAAFEDSIMIAGGYENPCGLRTNTVEIATLSTS